MNRIFSNLYQTQDTALKALPSTRFKGADDIQRHTRLQLSLSFNEKTCWQGIISNLIHIERKVRRRLRSSWSLGLCSFQPLLYRIILRSFFLLPRGLHTKKVEKMGCGCSGGHLHGICGEKLQIVLLTVQMYLVGEVQVLCIWCTESVKMVTCI